MTINDTGLVQVVRRHLNINLIADGDADEVFSHFAGDMSEDFVPVGKRHTEHCAGQHLCHISSQLYWLFFRHNIVELFNIAILF